MMKDVKTFWLSVFFVAMYFCGCSQSNEDEVERAKRFEALKGLSLDTVLTRAFKFHEQFLTTGDTLLRDSMDDYRNHFFARWKLSSDSLCISVPADDSLAADLRDIYEVVLEFEAKRKYRYILDREKRESLEKSLNETRKNAKSIDPIDVDEVLKRWNSDSMRTVRERADSIYALKIRAIPLDEALNRLEEDSSSIYNYAYFVQTLEVLYVDTAVADMKDLDKIEIFLIRPERWKKTNSACTEKTPMGQRILVLNKEYDTLLNNFMKTNVRESRRERYTFRPNKYPFWFPFINVMPEHWGEDYHFNSFPVIHGAVFNKAHDMVKLNVMQGFNGGDFYYLSKYFGKWEVVRRQDGWVM